MSDLSGSQGFAGQIADSGLSGGGYGGQVRASQLRRILLAHLSMRWPPLFIWGPPGVGKSSVVRQVAAERRLEVLDLRMLLLDPVDLRGLPVPYRGKVRWSPPEFLPEKGKGILFLDELNAAPPLVQASVYQLVLDRKIGEYRLPDGWMVVAAGNRESDQSIAHAMPSALRSRFEHLELIPDLESWKTWAYGAGVHASVIAFLEFRPALLYQMLPESKPFPCPRTWEMVSRVLSLELGTEEELRVLEGCVGTGAATEFDLFRKSLNVLPKLERVIEGMDALPPDAVTGYALVSGLVARYGREPARLPRLIAYAEHLGRSGFRELEVLLIRDLVRRNPSVSKSPAFRRWAEQNVQALG
ncbi:MAG: MoxR family ATPase [Thermoplasmata archaeon]|nr:MoxR family ATPase [Thermoplasmata archaeon]